MRTILLIMIGLSSFLSADFTRTGSSLTDSKTALTWQDSEDKQHKWKEAIEYCETLRLDGYEDWRLPNINELKSIINRNRNERLSIVSSFNYVGGDIFLTASNTFIASYWSSTTRKDATSFAMIVSFFRGSVRKEAKDSLSYVRCVRAGK